VGEDEQRQEETAGKGGEGGVSSSVNPWVEGR